HWREEQERRRAERLKRDCAKEQPLSAVVVKAATTDPTTREEEAVQMPPRGSLSPSNALRPIEQVLARITPQIDFHASGLAVDTSRTYTRPDNDKGPALLDTAGAAADRR